ncbi:putative 3-oxo-5-alpha-steroid 4-dehydrogenase 1 isoform 3 [Scophthalmus maximus]|uniref:Putative 3-oxo-5-alpha-steroid 4-dehydrogenase 1 isoform 3 n=1 Tax=Scophthalmus maximus TaxID=52904 RepID=A0A2U9BLD7_SCOMX|nr:putative 3-oxo-5-alpha-steroid 4-dehydrogenase 1 isoform 3 [Scophthalmus maximus]
MDALLARLFSSDEQELYMLDRMAHVTVLMAACTFFTLLFENVPYGRYASSKYGFPVDVKFAWFVQELPAFLVPLCLVAWTTAAKTSLLPNQLLIAMYFCHYVQRSLIYPFLIRGGSVLWLVGWLVNVHSDHILRNLRKPGETGYKIPTGGMFEYVSGANFLGEITEWAGFALAGHSVHSSAFAIFTAVVLTSRAVAHHKWYLAKFEDYPKSRKALIPFLF